LLQKYTPFLRYSAPTNRDSWDGLGFFEMPTEIGLTKTRLHRLSDIETFQLTLEELQAIKREGKNVGQDFTFFMFWLPIGISSTLTLISVQTLTIKQYCTYLIFMILGFCFSAYFGFRAWRQRGLFESSIEQIISERRFGPAGDEKRELQPGQLRTMPLGPTGPAAPPDVRTGSSSPPPSTGPAGYVPDSETHPQPAREQK
jgi:hypothetical protein